MSEENEFIGPSDEEIERELEEVDHYLSHGGQSLHDMQDAIDCALRRRKIKQGEIPIEELVKILLMRLERLCKFLKKRGQSAPLPEDFLDFLICKEIELVELALEEIELLIENNPATS